MKASDIKVLLWLLVVMEILFVSFLDAKLYPRRIAGYDRLSEKIMDAMTDSKKSMIQPNGCTIVRDIRTMPITFVTDPSAGRFEFFRYADAVVGDDTIQLSAFGRWGDGSGEYQSPNDIATLDGIQLYILDTGNNRVARALFNLGEYNVTQQSPIGTSIGLNKPMGMGLYQTLSGLKIYIADTKNHRIIRLSESGILETAYGSYGTGIGQFNNPQDIARANNYLYIADAYNNRIVVLIEQLDGSIEWDKSYSLPESYSLVTSVDCDQNGNIFYIDHINCYVTKFSEGFNEFLWSVGSRGCFTNEYEYPRGIAVSRNCNDVLITETYDDYTGLRFLGSHIDILQVATGPQHFDATIPGEQSQISLKIDDVARVSVEILENSDHIRWMIQDLMLPAGSHSESFLIWDGTDDDDGLCLPGEYIVKITATDAYDNTTDTTVSIIIEGTRVQDLLSENEHWTLDGEPYVLTGDVTLAYNGQLVIDPGVKIMPTGDYALKFPTSTGKNGIFAIGTPINKILFTPHRKLYPQPDSIANGFWQGIYFAYRDNDTLMLEHCVIEAAGSDTAAVYARNRGQVIMNNCEISKSGAYGYYDSHLRAFGAFSSTQIRNCSFKDNDSLPIRVAFSSICEVNNNTFENNKVEAIEVVASERKYSGMIDNQGIPYWVIPRRHSSSYFSAYFVGTVDSCVALTIEPGTKMMFADSTILQGGHPGSSWRAKIIAEGTEQDSIIFSALDTINGWRGIEMNSNDPADISIFEYCRISYGGQKVYTGSYVSRASLVFFSPHTPYILKNSTINHSKTIGLNHHSGGDISIIPIIENNQFAYNDSFPLVIWANLLRELKNNSFIENSYNEIYVYSERINESLVWQNQGVPYIVDGSIYTDGYGDTVLLEIESGNIIKFKQDCQLRIQANDRLIAHSTKFTAADSLPWHQIYFYNADTSIIDSCIIEHTHKTQYGYPGAVCIKDSSIVAIKNSMITNNEYGIYIRQVYGGSPSVDVISNKIHLNEIGIYNSSSESQVYVKYNDFLGNKCAFVNGVTSNIIQADSNWWGDATGPWDPSEGPPDSNPAGRGDSIGDYVHYRPWLESPVHGQVVTLTQPNGGEILYAETNYEIQWLIEPGRDLPQILRQELYYTTDFPEGGARDQALWQFIDTVDVSQMSYLWNVVSVLSNRCRVAIKIYYEGTRMDADIDTDGRGLFNEIASPLDKLGTRNDTLTLTLSHQGRGDMVENLFYQGRGKKAELLAMTNDYEYEGRGMNTVSMDISDGNFAIVDTVSPQITLTSPNGGEYFIPTKAETIKWQASDNHKLDHFNIYLSTDGGTNYSTTIIENLEAPCSTYIWIPQEENSYTCKIKVVAYDSSDNNNDDVSNDLFYIPVKSNLDEMTAYNNARRLIRSFFSNLRLVYTTQSESGENKGNQGSAREIEDRNARFENDATRGLVAFQSNNNIYKGRGTSQVYYTHSTNMGQNWSDPIELGNGIYPSITMDQDAPSIIGVAWTNISGSKVLYKYCNAFGIWSGLYTIFNEASDITYSPVAIQFAKDSIHLVSLRTTQITSSELVQDVLYLKFPWTDPSSCATMDTVDHWRIAYENPLPEFVSIAVDYDGIAHLAWERPPGDTMFTTPTPFDIFYALRGGLFVSGKYNISNSDDNSIHPSADCYGGHCYVVWQEKVNGYNVFLYKRNYVQFPPKPETDTISQTSANSLYPVSRMGGVVLWAEGDPAEIYGRIWDSQNKFWLELENWSNTSEHSMYPQVDAWQSEGSTDIIGAWTENTDTCGLGQHFVSFFPGREYAEIAFPSYCLTLGDSMSTPFTEYRDTIAIYQEDKFDLGIDSLVYYLPYINANAKCRIMIELYRPDTNRVRGKGNKWKIKLDIDGTIQQAIKLSAGELKVLQLDIPAVVNMDEDATIKFTKQTGDFILVRRILFYEYEREEEGSGSFLAGGPQSNETMQISPVFFEGIYPNPARGNLRIRFNSPDEQKVTIKLYDVTGRLINEIFNGKAKIGINEIPIMAEKYAAGIYFIRIEVDKEIITEKFIMLK